MMKSLDRFQRNIFFSYLAKQTDTKPFEENYVKFKFDHFFRKTFESLFAPEIIQALFAKYIVVRGMKTSDKLTGIIA